MKKLYALTLSILLALAGASSVLATGHHTKGQKYQHPNKNHAHPGRPSAPPPGAAKGKNSK